MKNKKTARNENKRFLSVVPVTSRETTGTTPRQPNIRAIMKLRVKMLETKIQKSLNEVKRLNAAIKALGKSRE